MKLSDFADLLDVELSVADTPVAGVTADSRALVPGEVFVALVGSRADGAQFAKDAQRQGASAIIVRTGTEVDVDETAVIAVDDPRHVLAMMAARFHKPQPDHVVAVTGTAGKTSVASFTRQIFSSGGLKAGSIGTTGVEAPGMTVVGALTTPDPVLLHTLLAELAGKGVTHVAMEASSHGLDQRRLDGVALTAAGFTNLGRDHLDYHADMDDYFAAKMRLFDTLLGAGKPAVIFADDAYSDRAIAACSAAGCDVRTVGRKGDYVALKRVEHERHRQIAEMVHGSKTHRVELPLAGDFQIANALVSAGLALSSGMKADAVFEALEHLKGAPGRLDLVGTTANGAPVYVDYAHKPEALEQVILSVRPFTAGRVVVVFGCGGDRDPGKRPIMGEIAAQNADVVYITDDNPRSEDPAAIRAAIMTAAPGAIEIGDRREAIVTAINGLERGDTLVIAGKGHETGQTAGGVTVPFSDHDEARNALAAGAS